MPYRLTLKFTGVVDDDDIEGPEHLGFLLDDEGPWEAVRMVAEDPNKTFEYEIEEVP